MSCSIAWKVTLQFRSLTWNKFNSPSWHLTFHDRYTERTPRPANPILRPAYQGSNPVADIFSFWALQTTVVNLPKIAKNPDDTEARRQMLYVNLCLIFGMLAYLNFWCLQASIFFCWHWFRKFWCPSVPWHELSSKSSNVYTSHLHVLIGLCYQISGLNKKGPKYKHPGYVTDLPIIPHGIRYNS